MNPVERFFRRYIFSTIRIVLLFVVINLTLFFLLMVSGNLSGSDKSFHIQELSEHVTLRNGVWTADDTALSLLEESRAWAMLLDPDGTVIWQQNLPETLPRSYTSADIASFSRWYLEDYPVKVWAREDGSLVVAGFPPRTLIKYYYVLNWPYMGVLLGGSAAIFLFNLFLISFLLLRNTRRVEKAITPVLQGIQDLSHGSRLHLKEEGGLAEINAGLNRASAYMTRKDNTRAEWIRGVSHDIRTPLSMVLGYASELEDNMLLPREARKQAGIIRRESEKMKRLIDDLNLTTRLEYSLQAACLRDVDLVELGRQAVSEVLNNGLPRQYDLTFSEVHPGRPIHLSGDAGLLLRMLDNLIQNSITHNPQGCKIILSVDGEDGRCLCSVSDNGTGLSPVLLDWLNRGQDISSSQEGGAKAEHGLGLKLVRQIVRAHKGTLQFSDSLPHGLTVQISLPGCFSSQNAYNKKQQKYSEVFME